MEFFKRKLRKFKNGVGEDVLPKITVESNWHPRNKEREKLFEPIKDWEYINV